MENGAQVVLRTGRVSGVSPHRPGLTRTAVISSVVAAVSLLLTASVWLAVGREARTEPVAGVAAPAHVEVLRSWDERRARAWAGGDAAALRALYVVGSRTGAHDVAMLRRYRSRGLRVVGLETQLVSVTPIRAETNVLLLDVIDRVTGAEVVGDGTRRTLPADLPSRRQVALRRVGGTWVVDEVVEAPP